MKIFNKQTVIVAAAAILTSVTGCKKYLVEKPESALYPSYFTTAGGVAAAVTGVYADLRQAWSGEGMVYMYDGTDQNIPGGSSGTNPVYFNNFTNINSSDGPDITSLYVDINTLNGVLQYASAITDPTARAQYTAQAQFLRGWIYFWLVQTYGGVTATQQSGIPLHTTFINSASTADAPAKLSDIYALIISDFTTAAANLPATVASTSPFPGKTATSAVANAYLAKAYLTRGYTEAAVSTDFQQAATLTQALITNQATYGLGLWQDYNDAMKAANDYGKENMFGIDYGISNPSYSGYTLQGSGGYGLNELYVLARFNYVGPGIDNYIAGTVDASAIPQKLSTKTGMFRDVYNGRPYIRLAPNANYVQNVAFADQINDTRYDATFQTFWICDQAVGAGTTFSGGLKGVLTPTTPISTSSYVVPTNGDTAILMPSVATVTNARRDAFKGLITTQAQWNNTIFPTVKKFDDPARTAPNDFSSRPIIMMRFSEVYLMNAEANYMMGNTAAAAADLNVIRTRAAYRTVADGATVAKNQFSSTTASVAADNTAHAAAMQLTAQQLAQLALPNNTADKTTLCGMDLILDEYSREFYGDPRRWYDLVRTQQLVRRNQMYNTLGAANVKAIYARWPIPQGLINNVLSGPKYPQNNGY